MRLAISARFDFVLDTPGDALMQFEAAALPDQRILDARTDIRPSPTLNRVAAQDDIGERIWMRGQGAIDARYDARIEITRDAPDLSALGALPLHLLPSSVVKYLFDSRFCHGTQFTDFAEGRFGTIEPGGAMIAAARDWVAGHTIYAPGASHSGTTATDTFHSGQGICRDYAHLFVTLARACSIPARYVACYAPGVTPPDFHAVAQVFLADKDTPESGAWHLIDATGMADPARTAIIGVGRDAADVSFLTSFSPMRFGLSEVRVEAESEAPSRRNDNAPNAALQRPA